MRRWRLQQPARAKSCSINRPPASPLRDNWARSSCLPRFLDVKLFATQDIAASIRKAHEGFTHVLVNRGYTTIKPVFFRSGKIADLPVYQWAWWDSSTDRQLSRWRAAGGILLDRYTLSDRAGENDVLVFVECPLTMKRIEQSSLHTAEYAVIPRPHTWRVHEECIELRTPAVERLHALWGICRGARLTDADLASASGIPKQHVTYMCKSLRSTEEWQIMPRLEPEFAGFVDAWKWIGAGRVASRKDVRLAGHKVAIKEMARLGHIALGKYRQYSAEEPDWERLGKKRAAAISDLAAVRSLVESLPDHLQT